MRWRPGEQQDDHREHRNDDQDHRDRHDLPAAARSRPFESKLFQSADLLFVGRVDAVEFAQKRRPIEFVGIVAAGGAGIGASEAGADYRLR